MLSWAISVQRAIGAGGCIDDRPPLSVGYNLNPPMHWVNADFKLHLFP